MCYAMSSTHPSDIARASYERARRAAHRHKQLVCKACGLIFTTTRRAYTRTGEFCVTVFRRGTASSGR